MKNKAQVNKAGLVAALLLSTWMPSAVAQEAPNPGTAIIPLRSIPETHTMAPRPEQAPPADALGATVLKVWIGTDGVPTSTEVQKSSCSELTDMAAAEHVKNVWRWKPAIFIGTPVTSTTLVSFNWGPRKSC